MGLTKSTTWGGTTGTVAKKSVDMDAGLNLQHQGPLLEKQPLRHAPCPQEGKRLVDSEEEM